MRKNSDEIAKMRRAGRVVAEMHERCVAAARPDVTTAELDQIAREVLERRGARSNFLNYHGFPAVICTSPNDVIVHGIPGDYKLQEGDILSLDCGAIIEGYHGDAAVTIPIGEVSPEARKLMEVTEESLRQAIQVIREGNRLSDVGHGIGTAMHEEPQIPNYGPPGRGIKLRVGHVFAVEPMVNMGGPGTVLMDDGWTVKTADGSLSAHFEHTIAVTDDGPEVLTVPG